MIFFGKRKKGFREKLYVLRVYRNFARARFEHESRYSHDVADVVILKRDVVVAQLVYGKVALYRTLTVENDGKRGLAHNTLAYKPPRNADRLIFVFIVVILNVTA